MAEAIKIQVVLDPTDIGAAGQKIARQLQSALDSSVSAAQATGKKIGDALSDGIQQGLKKLQQIQSQFNQSSVAGVSGANNAATQAFSAHQARLQQISLQANARLEAIATQAAARQAQIAQQTASKLQVIAAQTAAAQARAFRPPSSDTLTFFKRYSSTIREAGESIQQAGFALLGFTAGIVKLGTGAVQSAINIDRQVNVLKALTGSAEEAEKRFAQLVATAAKSPGLTTSLAATLDAQLRVANVSVQTIDRILPAIGKLNAVAPLGDPGKFAANLVQLITQNFERQDLKELVGQSPLAGELIKQIFNVDNATNAKAIRESAQKLGITSTEAFFAAFASAAANNSKLAKVTESIGTQFEKLKDRVGVALRPLGLTIIQTLAPLVEKLVPIIERVSKAFADLPASGRQAIIVLGAIAAAVGPLVIAAGGLIQTFGALGNIITVLGGVTGAAGVGAIGAALAPILPIILAIVAAIGVLAAAWATDFGGIRAITGDALGFIRDESSLTSKAIMDISPSLTELKSAFQKLSDEVKPLFREMWETVKSEAKIGLAATAAIIRQTIEGLTSLGSLAQSVGSALGGTLATALTAGAIDGLRALKGKVGAVLEEILTAGTGSTIRRIARLVSPSAEAPGAPNLTPVLGSGGNIVRQLEEQQAAARASATRTLGGGRSGRSGADAARTLREAELRSQKQFLDDAARLQKDSNDRQLHLLQEQFDDQKLLTAEGFARATITLRGYYDERLRLAQGNINGQIGLIDSEIDAENKALRAARANTPERARLLAEINKLTTDREILVRSLTDAEQENFRKFGEGLRAQREALLDELQRLVKQSEALGNKLDEKNLPTDLIAPNSPPAIVQQGLDNLQRAAEARIQTRIADIQLQQQELSIQQAIQQGVISEAQGKEATLAVQRQYRDVLIATLEAQRSSLGNDQEALGRLNLEIDKLRGLGAELTPAQAFFKGLKSQAETTAEAFERIGQRFKDSILAPIDSGIDRLTKKFGIFKDVLGDILKLLARQIISKLFGGGGQQFAAPGGQQGGGFNFGSLFGGGGNGGGGILGGLFGGNQQSSVLTAPFNPNAGGGLPGIFNQGQQQGGVGGLLQSIPLLGKLFGGGGAGGAGHSLGGGLAAPGGSGLLGSLSGLGASGLLAGGGLLGSLAGGKSQFGQLLGGVGGTLLAGTLGATGIFGGAVAGALPALFSNPITAIIGGALVGTALLAGFLKDREFNKFRKEVEREYQIKVDKKDPGRSLYQAEKELGEQTFGKGKFGKKIIDTIRLDKGQELLAAYAEASGQENNALVRKFRDIKELTDPSDPRNQFVKRAFGGFVPFPDLGRDTVLTALRGQEFVNTPDVVRSQGVHRFEALQAGRAAIVTSSEVAPIQSKASGGYVSNVQIVPSPSRRFSVAGGTSEGADNSGLWQMVLASNARLIRAIESFEGIDDETIVRRGLSRAPDAAAEAVDESIRNTSPAGLRIKGRVYGGR